MSETKVVENDGKFYIKLVFNLIGVVKVALELLELDPEFLKTLLVLTGLNKYWSTNV